MIIDCSTFFKVFTTTALIICQANTRYLVLLFQSKVSYFQHWLSYVSNTVMFYPRQFLARQMTSYCNDQKAFKSFINRWSVPSFIVMSNTGRIHITHTRTTWLISWNCSFNTSTVIISIFFKHAFCNKDGIISLMANIKQLPTSIHSFIKQAPNQRMITNG